MTEHDVQRELGVIYNGRQERVTGEPLYLFTDPVCRYTTIAGVTPEDAKNRIIQKRQEWGCGENS